jgi:hypothetical protein
MALGRGGRLYAMAESFCHACFSSEKEELLSSAQFTEPEGSGIHGMAIGRP